MTQAGPSEQLAQSAFAQQRVTHWPFTQVSPRLHTVPHPPQLAGSVRG